MTRTQAHRMPPTESPMKVEFDPKILGFLCNWCSYAGADLAGVSRFQYPPTIRIIRVMCSGRVDPVFVLRAFSRGVDGVMVLGCHPGDCHYATGNYYARNRVQVLQQLLGLAEISPDRLVLDWVSAGEGERFATLVTDFTERVKTLGPLGLSEGLSREELRERLATSGRVVESETIRWLVGRKREMVENGNIYGEAVAEEAFDALLESSVATEYLRNRLLILTAGRPLSVKEMAGEIGVAPRLVLPHVAVLEQAGLMAMVNVEGNSPKYQRM
jgi:F420-non-reducing hydrogenase iron-sulfur subunit